VAVTGGGTFQQRLEGGDLLQLDDVGVAVDVTHGLGALGHHHDVVHLRLVLGWGRHHHYTTTTA